jgi:hypothetical protein
MGVEPMTSSLPRTRSTTELQQQYFFFHLVVRFGLQSTKSSTSRFCLSVARRPDLTLYILLPARRALYLMAQALSLNENSII